MDKTSKVGRLFEERPCLVTWTKGRWYPLCPQLSTWGRWGGQNRVKFGPRNCWTTPVSCWGLMRMAKKLLTPTHCSLLLFPLQVILYEIDALLLQLNQYLKTDCHLIYEFCVSNCNVDDNCGRHILVWLNNSLISFRITYK